MARQIEFTVMTINAGGGRRAGSGQLNLNQIARGLCSVIPAVQPLPDLIAVQESVEVHWHGGRSQETAQLLSQRLNQMGPGTQYWSHFSECVDSDFHTHRNKWQPHSRPNKFQGYTRAKEGNALIANKPIGEWPWDVPDPGYPAHGRRAPITTQISGAGLYSTGNRDTQPRNLIVVPLIIGEATVYFMATHLATLTKEGRYDLSSPRSKQASDLRLAQAREIVRVVEELRNAEHEKALKPVPIILAGDFNAVPRSPEVHLLQQTFLRPPPRWQNPLVTPPFVWTHTGHRIHVDHIFYNDPDGLLTPLDCYVLMPRLVGSVTDHLPVVARFWI